MRILYLEDKQQDADLVQRALARSAPGWSLEVAGTLGQARQRLAEKAFDLALLDLVLPDGSGLELLAEIRRQGLSLAVIILTGHGDEQTAVAALKAGADDYLSKGEHYVDRLPLVLEAALERFRAGMARTGSPIRVLYVEHNAADVDLTRRYLARHAPHIRLEVVSRAALALERLPAADVAPYPWDVLLLDYRLPGLDALELMKIVRQERGLDLPIVLVTGRGDQEVAVQALRLGASDYLVKHGSYLAELPAALEKAHYQGQLAREQAALRQSEARFRRLAENAHDVIYRYDLLPEGHFGYLSPAVLRLTGYTPEEFYQDPGLVNQVVHPDDRPLLARLAAAEAGERVLPILRWQHRQGRIVWTEHENVPVRDDQGTLVAIEGIARDITPRKEAEEERTRLLAQLRQETARVQRILESVPAGVLLLDEEGQVLLANPPAEEALEALARGHGGRLSQLGHLALSQLLLPAEEATWHELRVGSRTFELGARPVESEAEAGRWVLVLNDVTSERERENYQQAQERLATVGQLAAGIAHDFNNVMGVIVLYSQMLRQLPDLPDKARRQLQTINAQAQHAARLIGQILDFSRRTLMERAPVNLLPLVKELVKLLENTLPESIRVELHYDRSEYVVLVDPTRLQQALMNLAINARDAMPDGGRLAFNLLAFTLAQGEAAPLPDVTAGEWLRLEVADTGTGIAPEHLPHIFEPFFTTKPPGKGTGLGLAQVYGIVKQHGGSIDVQSVPGGGAKFLIFLPLQEGPPVAPAPAPEEGAATGGSEAILLVEDNLATRMAVEDTLEAAGYRVLSAANGVAALALLAQEGEAIDLVLTDLVMPQMGGLDLYRQVRRDHPGARMLLMTGYPLEQAAEKWPEEGLADWIQKPFDTATLARKVREVLDRG